MLRFNRLLVVEGLVQWYQKGNIGEICDQDEAVKLIAIEAALFDKGGAVVYNCSCLQQQ